MTTHDAVTSIAQVLLRRQTRDQRPPTMGEIVSTVDRVATELFGIDDRDVVYAAVQELIQRMWEN